MRPEAAVRRAQVGEATQELRCHRPVGHGTGCAIRGVRRVHERVRHTSDGAQLTLSPESCVSKASSEKTECLEPGDRTYSLTTVQLEELTPNERVGVTFKGVRFTGPFPGFSQGPNPYSYRELQRVQ